jgi:hypothetical protein
MTTERRRRRSSDPLVALHYQLTHARKIGALETIVIADDSGVVVAGSGSWAACEELAAYAPLLAGSDSGSSRISTLRSESLVKRLSVGSSTIIVCAKGSKDDAARSAVDQASAGAARILAA